METLVTFLPGLLAFAFYATVVAVILMLIYEERDPSTTLAWVLVLVLIPGLGLLAYFLVGRNWRRISQADRRLAAARARGDEVLAPIYARHAGPARELEVTDPPLIGRLISAIRNQNGTEPLPCYDLAIFPSGAEKFERLLQDIAAATDHVHLEYFIWEQDALTERVCNLLIEKVREGVEVRVLYDWFGSLNHGKRQLKALEAAGGMVAADTARLSKLNYRNHRKISVIDGRIAYTGGMNMGQEYIDGGDRFPTWRDTHIRFGGPLVADLQRLFAQRWFRTKREDLFTERYFPELEDETATNAVWAQVVHSGPESRWQAVRQAFLLGIASAEKRVQIQSPYFVPDQAIEDALVAQSLAGVEMRLMMTGLADKGIAWWAAFTYADDFVEAGGQLLHYMAGFLHAKTMTIDGTVAMIGTTNFDIRSFALHDELTIVFYDEGVAASQDAIFEDDVTRSRLIPAEEMRAFSRPQRLRNALARLTSRML